MNYTLHTYYGIPVEILYEYDISGVKMCAIRPMQKCDVKYVDMGNCPKRFLKEFQKK